MDCCTYVCEPLSVILWVFCAIEVKWMRKGKNDVRKSRQRYRFIAFSFHSFSILMLLLPLESIKIKTNLTWLLFLIRSHYPSLCLIIIYLWSSDDTECCSLNLVIVFDESIWLVVFIRIQFFCYFFCLFSNFYYVTVNPFGNWRQHLN